MLSLFQSTCKRMSGPIKNVHSMCFTKRFNPPGRRNIPLAPSYRSPGTRPHLGISAAEDDGKCRTSLPEVLLLKGFPRSYGFRSNLRIAKSTSESLASEYAQEEHETWVATLIPNRLVHPWTQKRPHKGLLFGQTAGKRTEHKLTMRKKYSILL